MSEQEYNKMQINLTLRQAFKLMGEDYAQDNLVKLISVGDKKRWTIANVKSCLENEIRGASVYRIRAWFANEEFKGYEYYVDDDVLDKGWIE